MDALLEDTKADEDMIDPDEWKNTGVPLDLHSQLLWYAYEGGWDQYYQELLDAALIRLKFRRYEVPYLTTVDVLMSAYKDANVPNGFEKLPLDLN